MMLNLEDDEGPDWLKVLITGQSGTGKTSFGASAPGALIALSELQGKRVIVERARANGLPRPTILRMESLRDYRSLRRALEGDRSKPFVVESTIYDSTGKALDRIEVLRLEEWPQTIVIDSLTDACELVRSELLREVPAKLGEDGLPVMSQRHWQALRDRCEKLIRSFRDVQAHVIFLALLDDRTTETTAGETTRHIGPLLPMRALPPVVLSCVNVAGIMRRKVSPQPGEDGNREVYYAVQTNGPDWQDCKPYRPLADFEVPDFRDWLRRVNGPVSSPVVDPDDGDDGYEPLAGTDSSGHARSGPVQPSQPEPEVEAEVEPVEVRETEGGAS